LNSSTPGVSPIGSKVWLVTDGRKIPAHIITGDSYQSQHPFTAHFGLNQTRQVEKIQVRWPDGTTQELVRPEIDTYHTVRYNPE
jgi:hypothetical protein